MCEFCCGTHVERGILPIEEKLFSLVCEYVNNPIIRKIKNRCLLLIIAIQVPYTLLLPFATFLYWNLWFLWMIVTFDSSREAGDYFSQSLGLSIHDIAHALIRNCMCRNCLLHCLAWLVAIFIGLLLVFPVFVILSTVVAVLRIIPSVIFCLVYLIKVTLTIIPIAFR